MSEYAGCGGRCAESRRWDGSHAEGQYEEFYGEKARFFSPKSRLEEEPTRCSGLVLSDQTLLYEGSALAKNMINPASDSVNSDSFYIPPLVAQAGVSEIHQFPLVLDADKQPVHDPTNHFYRVPADRAWAEYPRIELNPPNSIAAIILDIDKPATGRGWNEYMPVPKPTPSWIVQAERTGKCHVGYALETPVHKNDASRLPPLQFAGIVADKLTRHLNADRGYHGPITRNLVTPGEGVFSHVFFIPPYTLKELDALLPRYSPSRRLERESGIGRNVDLFRRTVSEAHQPQWQPIFASEGYGPRWLAHVEYLNDEMHPSYPLPKSECRSIAKSAMRYAVRQFSHARFREIQTGRIAKRWHGKFDFDFEARDGWIVHLKERGLSNARIAKYAGLSKQRVGQILSKLAAKRADTQQLPPESN